MNNNTILHPFPGSDNLWRGIGNHFDSLGEIMNEFIDNSISNFKANNAIARAIAIYIECRGKNGYDITVEDSGTGIKNLEAAVTLGSRAGAETPLNEHGFGFKHALAAGNPQNDNWSVKTCTADMRSRNEYCEIKAPYRIDDLPCEVCQGSWSKAGFNTGTAISFHCSEDLFKTITRGCKGNYSLHESIMEILCEYLGYTYSGVIKSMGIPITIVYKDDAGETFLYTVSAVEPSWAKCKSKSGVIESFNLGNGPVQIEFTFGRIERSQKTKRFYQANLASSGVEIRINGRAIESNLFKKIWGIENHPSYNQFLGVVNIVSDKLERLPRTKTSKNGLREGDPILSALFSWIMDKLPADRIPKNDSRDPEDMTENDLVEKLKVAKETHLERLNPDVDTQRKAYVSIGEDIKMDLFVAHSGDTVVLYEAKKGSTKVLDIYQLMMYWDGYVFDHNQTKDSPTEAILIGAEHSDAVKRVVEEINENRKDAKNNPYKIRLKTWKQEGINWPID